MFGPLAKSMPTRMTTTISTRFRIASRHRLSAPRSLLRHRPTRSGPPTTPTTAAANASPTRANVPTITATIASPTRVTARIAAIDRTAATSTGRPSPQQGQAYGGNPQDRVDRPAQDRNNFRNDRNRGPQRNNRDQAPRDFQAREFQPRESNAPPAHAPQGHGQQGRDVQPREPQGFREPPPVEQPVIRDMPEPAREAPAPEHRATPAAAAPESGLPAFITAPSRGAPQAPVEAQPPASAPSDDFPAPPAGDGEIFPVRPRRRRRTRAEMDAARAAGSDETPVAG